MPFLTVILCVRVRAWMLVSKVIAHHCTYHTHTHTEANTHTRTQPSTNATVDQRFHVPNKYCFLRPLINKCSMTVGQLSKAFRHFILFAISPGDIFSHRRCFSWEILSRFHHQSDSSRGYVRSKYSFHALCIIIELVWRCNIVTSEFTPVYSSTITSTPMPPPPSSSSSWWWWWWWTIKLCTVCGEQSVVVLKYQNGAILTQGRREQPARLSLMSVLSMTSILHAAELSQNLDKMSTGQRGLVQTQSTTVLWQVDAGTLLWQLI